MDSTSTTSRQLAFATFDVFTQQRLRGNPLAIVEIPKDCVLDQDIKQAIAKEFNYSETVFLHEAENEGSLDRRIDIFTTLSELAFAGHPTIGTICCIGGNATAGAAHAFNVMTKAGEVQSTYDKSNSRAVACIYYLPNFGTSETSVIRLLISILKSDTAQCPHPLESLDICENQVIVSFSRDNTSRRPD